MGRKELDGNDAVQAGVAGAVNLAHAARPERGNDLVGSEFGACS